jgi:hypothetical protein
MALPFSFARLDYDLRHQPPAFVFGATACRGSTSFQTPPCPAQVRQGRPLILRVPLQVGQVSRFMDLGINLSSLGFLVVRLAAYCAQPIAPFTGGQGR